MTPPPKNLYWDSCIFIRYLTRRPADLLGHIDQYVAEARDGKVQIHCSTLVFTEIRPRFLKQRGFGKAQDFLPILAQQSRPSIRTPTYSPGPAHCGITTL